MRFPNFEGEWERGELGKISKISKGSGISKDQLSDNGEPCILYGELYTQYKSEIIDEVRSRTNTDTKLLVRSEANDIIIPSSGETAVDISTARCVRYSGILLGGDLNIIKLLSGDGCFFSYQLNGVRKYDIARIAQGVSVVHLYGENLKKLNVFYPSAKEQGKIAIFLSLLDQRISTQIKIIEELESLIAKFMENILNQKLKIPNKIEGNFPAWKEITLKECSSIKSGLSSSQNEQKIGYKVTRIETISTRFIDINRIGYVNTRNDISEYKLNLGDILFSNINSVSHIGKTAIVTTDYDLYHGMNLLRIVPNQQIVIPLFLFYTLNSRKNLNYFKTICNKAVSQASINQADLGNFSFNIPSYLEQSKIAFFLSTMKNKILIEKDLLFNYQKQKQYLLKHLFI